MNEAIRRAKQEGYVRTGIVAHEWKKEEAVEKAKQYRVDGNKVKILLECEVSNFRDRTDKSYWWVVMYKPTELYLAKQKAAHEEQLQERRHFELRRMADTLSMEELAWMLKDKVDRMSMEELLMKKPVQYPLPKGTKAYYDYEESTVEILESKPCKASVLSSEDDAFDYLIRFKDGHTAWVSFDDLGLTDEQGNPAHD